MAKCQRPRRVKPSDHRWAEYGWIQFTLSDPGVGTSAQSWFAILQRLQQGRWAVGLCHPETSFKMLQAQTQIEGSSTSVTSGCSVRFFSVPFRSIHLFVESIGDLFFCLRLHQIYVVRIHVHSARSNYFEHLWTTPCPIQSTSSPVDGRTGWKHKTWRAAVVAWHLWRTLSLQPLDMFGASSWSHGFMSHTLANKKCIAQFLGCPCKEMSATYVRLRNLTHL